MLKVLKQLKVHLEEKEILRLQGYRKNEAVKDAIAELLAEEIKEGYCLITPKAMYTELEIKEMERGVVKLANGLELKVGAALKYWKGAQVLAVALCTIGPALEKKVDEIFAAQEFARGLMLDSVGSVAVENLADQVNYLLCQKARKPGQKTGPRLSPGYGGWGLADQKVLFTLLAGEEIGVTLNAQNMMLPRKSVSFCLGIGKKLTSLEEFSPCLHCNLKHCPYRREVIT